MKQKVAETWLISNQYVWSVIIAQWKSDGQILLRELHLSRTNHYRGQPRTDESIISINRVFTCSEQNRLPTSHIISVEFTVENSKGQSGTPLRETITCLFLDTSTNSISFCHRVRSYWLLSTPKKSTVEKLLTSALNKAWLFLPQRSGQSCWSVLEVMVQWKTKQMYTDWPRSSVCWNEMGEAFYKEYITQPWIYRLYNIYFSIVQNPSVLRPSCRQDDDGASRERDPFTTRDTEEQVGLVLEKTKEAWWVLGAKHKVNEQTQWK